jgi:hypothetical protein
MLMKSVVFWVITRRRVVITARRRVITQKTTVFIIISTPHRILLGGGYIQDEISRACGMYGGEEKSLEGFGGKTWREETTRKT